MAKRLLKKCQVCGHFIPVSEGQIVYFHNACREEGRRMMKNGLIDYE